jgi:hypothetical protein
MSSNFGPIFRNSRSPACVGVTLRVVRFRSLTPYFPHDADPLLQISDDLAEGRLRHPQFRGGPREIAFSRHREKSEEVARVFPMH